MITINHWWLSTLFGRIGSCKNLPPLQIYGSPVEIRASVQVQGRSLQLQLQKDSKFGNRQPQMQNCKITQQKWEENCKTELRAMSTILYSRFTITIRNIIVLIPWHEMVQMMSSSCTHICNIQIVYLAYHHHVWTVTCKSSIWNLTIM